MVTDVVFVDIFAFFICGFNRNYVMIFQILAGVFAILR